MTTEFISGIDDAPLLRALAEDVPDMAPEIRNQLRLIAQRLDALAEAVREPLTDSKQYSDGTTATGPAPLPDFSPKQQFLLADLGAIEAMLGGRNGPTIRIRAAIEAGIST